MSILASGFVGITLFVALVVFVAVTVLGAPRRARQAAARPGIPAPAPQPRGRGLVTGDGDRHTIQDGRQRHTGPAKDAIRSAGLSSGSGSRSGPPPRCWR